MTVQPRSSQSGFTLLELMIAMGVMLLVLASTMQVMKDAMGATTTTKQMLDMNSHLRASMDLMQRDMLQVGQGLPVGRRIGIPNGFGSTPVVRPGPAATGACAGVTTFPLDSTIPAVSAGPDLGPPINGECTDVVTIMAADNLFEPVATASIAAAGGSAVIHDDVNISDDPDVNSDNLRAGDLLMFTKGTMSVLMQVTAVAGQTVTFGTGALDPLGLNQLDPTLAVAGTINQLKAQAPVDGDAPVVVGAVQQRGPSQVTRIRMLTYFVDTTTNPQSPRLVRAVGGAPPTVVSMGLQMLRLSYDIADQINNPTSVRMDDDDLSGAGACSPDPCSENQIRKVNLVLAMRAHDQGSNSRNGRQSQNTLYTQVSLRSMAFVDRYR